MSDWVRAFEVPALGLRGALLRLRASWRELSARGAPESDPSVTGALAEAVAATALFAGTLGLRAGVSLQARNAAPVALLFAECTVAGALRGVARGGGEPAGTPVLALTIEDAAGMRQQAHVPLERDGVAASLALHFVRSERLPTHWRIAWDGERASALLLQGTGPAADAVPAAVLDATAALDAATLHESATEALLTGVFPGEDVRLFAERALHFGCSCSRERVLAALRGIDPAELEDAHHAPLEVACECCGARYEIGRAELSGNGDGRSRSTS
jgi:molecular chaperone Hsp33